MSKQNEAATTENEIKNAVRLQLEDLDDRSLLSTVWEFVRDVVGIFTLAGRGTKLVAATEIELAKRVYVRKRLESDEDTGKAKPRKWFE